MLLEVAGGVHELAEDQHLVRFEHRVFLEQADECLQLFVLRRLEGIQLLEKGGDLVEVEKGLSDDFVQLELVAR